MDEQLILDFIKRWSNSGGAERANYQLFLAELETLSSLGKARQLDDGRYVPV